MNPHSATSGVGDFANGEVIEVAAGLVFREGKLLITQRYSRDHLGDLWEFPGGKREAGESFELCLQRELREELGIEIDSITAVETITHVYPEKTVHLRFFRCRWLQNEPRQLGCQAFAWVDRAGLGKYEFPPADARLLERLSCDPSLWV